MRFTYGSSLAIIALILAGQAAARAEAPVAMPAPVAEAAADAVADEGDGASIVVTARRTRSVVTLDGPEIQKIQPGASPLKAIQTLPGVTFLTADPWGNNEQNISLFIHGFNQQQLGYTLDGVPLGDQNYGNFNGLSPQRAIISENVGRVALASGAGDLGTASTSNLGGTIDTFSSAPKADRGLIVSQVFGSYSAFRTFARIDSGTFGNGNAFYLSGVRQDARAWDFNGHQGGYQANAKFVHQDSNGTLTLYGAYSDKTEPNEDSTVVTKLNALQPYQPYIRPFLYPDFTKALAYYANKVAYNGASTYAASGANYSNYYSAALRTDYLGYAKYDWNVADTVKWTNTGYYHHNDGVGIVAGPITAAGLPQLVSFYYPGVPGSSPTSPANLARLSTIFGGSGLATRTTEYRIDRGGVISTLRVELGNHQIELGGWFEHQSSSSYRRWYALDVSKPSSPYERPLSYAAPLITQYGSEVRVDVYQTHVQDSWHVRPNLTILAGFKSTFQNARQRVPVQPIPGSFTGSRELPVGKINTSRPFLPEIGAVWDATANEQIFVNAQQNIRQFQTSAAAGLSPFALGSQSLFDYFKANTRPETSWTYEAGIRTHRTLDLGPITAFEGQASYYHVDFSNRLLATSPNATISAIISGATILGNVGSVKTDGFDVSGTLHFGPHFSIYDAVSYNNSRYGQDYLNGTVVVPTRNMKVPGSPDWLNKTVVNANVGIVDLQVIGDYIGRRFATFTNDMSVPGYFTMSARIAATIPLKDTSVLRNMTVSLNVTNLTDKKAASTIGVGAAAGMYAYFPVAPRQFFGTLSFGF